MAEHSANAVSDGVPEDYIQIVMQQWKQEVRSNKDINAQLKKDKQEFQHEIKLLLLGTGESGKSTIAKQMKIIHLKGFTQQERQDYKHVVHRNVMANIKALLEGARSLNISINDPEVAALASKLESANLDTIITEELAQSISKLWNDPSVQQAYSQSSSFQLDDSAKYFFDNLERISRAAYVPDDNDIVRARIRTTGIHEIEFTLERRKFRLIDVGGQRSERRKWIHCFADVTAIIFCVAISEYDLKLMEDESVNRMKESIKVFGDIANNAYFTSKPIILFFNKKDIFEEKIKKVGLEVCFPDFDPSTPRTVEKCSKFIEKKFIAVLKNQKQSVYPHLTIATDTSNINHIFKAVTNIVLRQALDIVGM